MPLYGGIDLHANNRVVVQLNEQDQVIYQRRFANHLPTILEHFAPYHADLKGVGVESTSNWYGLVDGLMEAGYRVHLAHPAAMQQYSGLKYTYCMPLCCVTKPLVVSIASNQHPVAICHFVEAKR
jgi:transposase